jgi:hypothetical protein
MNKHTAFLAALILVSLPIAAVLIFGWTELAHTPKDTIGDGAGNGEGDGGAYVCTMDAKQCPGGSYVGRVGPKCEFAACPSSGDEGSGSGVRGEENAGTSVQSGRVTKDTFPYAEPDIAWRFADAGEFDGLPYTRVFLTIGKTEHSLGEYVGSCSDTVARVDLSGHVASILCWYAGGGNEVAVFEDAKNRGGYVVKVRDVDEGTAEVSGYRGAFKDVLRIR